MWLSNLTYSLSSVLFMISGPLFNPNLRSSLHPHEDSLLLSPTQLFPHFLGKIPFFSTQLYCLCVSLSYNVSDFPGKKKILEKKEHPQGKIQRFSPFLTFFHCFWALWIDGSVLFFIFNCWVFVIFVCEIGFGFAIWDALVLFVCVYCCYFPRKSWCASKKHLLLFFHFEKQISPLSLSWLPKYSLNIWVSILSLSSASHRIKTHFSSAAEKSVVCRCFDPF